MRYPGFWISYVILLAAQIVLCDCFNLTQLLSLWFLPVMVLCIPIRCSTPAALVIAFLSGMAVDVLSQGVLGLCTVAILPVALTRNLIIRAVFGGEVFSRGEDISIRRQGIVKMTLATAIATALFLLIFIRADGGFTRPFWFNFGRFFISLAADTLLSVLLCATVLHEESSVWR